MPKPTFDKLNETKRNTIIEAFLKEFSHHTYDDASITSVTKELGIAKGSIYQYFEDKMDLFLFLLQECKQKKLNYVGSLKREDFLTFWDFFRALFEHGLAFDQNHPYHSHFLHNLAQNVNSFSTREWFAEMEKQTLNAFVAMVQYEVDHHHFRNDVDLPTMGYILQNMGVAIQKQLQLMGTINPQESIQNGLPVYYKKEKELMDMVNTYIRMIQPAFQNNPQ